LLVGDDFIFSDDMIYWIDQIENCRIGISARPQGFNRLENEITELSSQNINLIISLLEDHEIEQFGLNEEELYCKRNNIKFDRLPIQDDLIPGFQRFADKIDRIFLELLNFENLVVHCNHGLGRSGLFVAALLLKSGMNMDSVLEKISLRRGFNCPTSPSQIKFIKAYDVFIKKKSNPLISNHIMDDLSDLGFADITPPEEKEETLFEQSLRRYREINADYKAGKITREEAKSRFLRNKTGISNNK